MDTSLAIVILNFNGQQHLETYLPSVLRYSKNIPIYVADNASTDQQNKNGIKIFFHFVLLCLKIPSAGPAGGVTLLQI